MRIPTDTTSGNYGDVLLEGLWGRLARSMIDNPMAQIDRDVYRWALVNALTDQLCRPTTNQGGRP